MFTGIITEIGTVRRIFRNSSGWRLEVYGRETSEGIREGESVSVNGVCLSVVSLKDPLAFDVVENTYKKTNLKRLMVGGKVNLEKALKIGDDVSGHMVSGHVDGERKVLNSAGTSSGWVIDIEMKDEDARCIVPRGSIAIDGVSLTVGEIKRKLFRIFLIPHTLKNTTLSKKNPGDHVNIEYDMNARYYGPGQKERSISMETLSEKGFI